MSRICSVFANVNLYRYVLITRNNYNNGQRYTENTHAGTRDGNAATRAIPSVYVMDCTLKGRRVFKSCKREPF
jgi:hypothetical protein